MQSAMQRSLFAEATNRSGIHRTRRGTKRQPEATTKLPMQSALKPTTPKTEARRVNATPRTETKTAEQTTTVATVEKENQFATPQKNLFDAPATPYLLRAIPDGEAAPTLTVVLDLDETLVSNRRLDLTAAILRPYALDALAALRRLPNIEIVMWTASTEETASPVVRQLSARGKVFDDIIFRDERWFTEPYHSKDLRVLGRSMDRVVFFDNAPNCCKVNKANSILVEDFTGFCYPGDNTLVNLYRICEQLMGDIENGGSVAESLLHLAEQREICTRVHYPLPEAWRVVDLANYSPLAVPPHGEFFKVPPTQF